MNKSRQRTYISQRLTQNMDKSTHENTLLPIFDQTLKVSNPRIQPRKSAALDYRSSSREKISYWMPSESNQGSTQNIININAYHEPENVDFEK